MFAGVFQAVAFSLQADMLRQTDCLNIPLFGGWQYMGLLGHTAYDLVTPSRLIFLILKSGFKEQEAVRKVSHFMSCHSFRYPACHVQTGYEALGEVHVRYIY